MLDGSARGSLHCTVEPLARRRYCSLSRRSSTRRHVHLRSLPAFVPLATMLVSASTVLRLCALVLLSATMMAYCWCEETAVGTADVTASGVLDSSGGTSGAVAALLTPRLASCVVKTQPGLASFVREHAAYYPSLRVVYTGDVPRLQLFHSAQHRRDNIVDSSEETDEQLIDRLQHPHSHSPTHV